jgi:hypothetical protein
VRLPSTQWCVENSVHAVGVEVHADARGVPVGVLAVEIRAFEVGGERRDGVVREPHGAVRIRYRRHALCGAVRLGLVRHVDAEAATECRYRTDEHGDDDATTEGGHTS